MKFQKFKTWIREQNSLRKFADTISDGTTVYFSDDFAACYDLRIKVFGQSEHTIVVQLNIESEDEVNERFLEISVETWTQLGWKIWYLDPNLQWMIIANPQGRKKYGQDDVIKSNRINFEFKLNQII